MQNLPQPEYIRCEGLLRLHANSDIVEQNILKGKVMFNIVLLEPEIPSNTGNIGRTCLITGSRLHLIEPMGFFLNDKNLKRAGMDYWRELDCVVYNSWEDFCEKNKGLINISGVSQDAATGRARLWMATTKARRTYCEADFKDGDFIMFGKESAGIPEEILLENRKTSIRIPMAKQQRSLNLSNAVAIVLYEALRQNEFPGLELKGQLHNHTW